MIKVSITILLSFFLENTFAQKQYKVFDWKSEQTVNTFLLSKMRQQYVDRNATLENALRSRQGIIAYRDSAQARYKKLIGLFPEKTPINVQQVGIIKQEGYHIEKIIYESIPNHHVTANLYIPQGKGPFPGVLLFCGHEDEAKATESYQKTAILFALNGFVVLVIDPISQAERHQLTDEDGKPSTRGGTTEHTLVNAASNLVGSGAVAYQLWDNIRGLDYLETRSEVDKNRIGCLGNSGGGTQTTYFVGFDDRIKVAAPCSFISSRERNFELFGANDGCQHVPGEGQAGLELTDFMIMFAPKPLLILAGRYDFIDYKGTQQVYTELKKVYTTFNASDKVKLFTADDGHGITKPKREEAVSWFIKWFYHENKQIREGELRVLPEESLLCTSAEQVNGAYKNEINDFDRTYEIAKHLTSGHSASGLKHNVIHVLNYKSNPSPVLTEHVGIIHQNDQVIHKLIIRKHNEMPLPVLMILPKEKPKEVALWLHDKGKNIIADSVSLVKQYLDEQKAIVIADVCGVGELTDAASANDPKYFNNEYRNAMLGIHIGQSLPSLRMRDIINLIDFISSSTDVKNIPLKVHATGVCTLPALHAAVLDGRITRLHAYESISSFYEIIKKPLQKNWYSYIIPGVLKYYDVNMLEENLGVRLIRIDKM